MQLVLIVFLEIYSILKGDDKKDNRGGRFVGGCLICFLLGCYTLQFKHENRSLGLKDKYEVSCYTLQFKHENR